MKSSGFTAFLARIDTVEYGICRRLNRGAASAKIRRVFVVASRLGDGVIWYTMILALPLLYGHEAARPALVMAITGIVGLAIYKVLKTTFVRERPFITHSAIARAAAPLDRYSFPSGHTLHAVSFSWQITAHYPELGYVCVPLAVMIAASRVVLGLHYPSDVLVGAIIGAVLASVGLAYA